jgi:integrase
MDRLEAHGSTIMDAVLTHLAEKLKSAPSKIKVSALLEEYLAAKEGEHLSPYYVKDLRRKLNRFAASFPCSISSIKSGDIKKWITKQGSGRNAQNLHTSVSSFFSYAQEMDYLPANEKHAAELVTKVKAEPSPIGIYTPEELAKILAHTPEELLPTISIAAFAGLRSAELFRLDWSEIKIDQGHAEEHIEVTAGKSKTSQRRIVPILPCLKAWLSPRKKKTGRVTPDLANLDNLTRKYSAICKKAGVESQRNGFRHSFASYRLAKEQSTARVSLEMGNSPVKLHSNYVELVTNAAALEWFDVTPPKVKKVKNSLEQKPIHTKARKGTSRSAKAPAR